jgi:hypothetical protein
VEAVVGKGRRRLFQDGYEDITYKQVNDYVIQQFVLMTKWIEEYERQNQLYLHVVELWNRVRKSSRGQRHEKPKDHVAWIHQEILVRKGSGGFVSEKEYDIAGTTLT